MFSFRIFSLGKKGVFFSVVAMIVVLTLIMNFNYSTEQSVTVNFDTVSNRIMSMDDFVSDIDDDMTRALYIASYRGLLGMTQYISDNGVYITNIDGVATEIILDGNISGVKINITEESYFRAWILSVKQIANQMNLNVNFSNYNITAYQKDPWNVYFRLNVTVFVDDFSNLANWTVNKSVETFIPIYEFEDPIYTVQSNKQILNKIVKTPYYVFVNAGDKTNFTDHLDNSYYIESILAPSYLDRLQGNSGASPFGIESLVRDYGELVETRSRVDYIYMFDLPTGTLRKVTGTNVYLDNETLGGFAHFEMYQVSNILDP